MQDESQHNEETADGEDTSEGIKYTHPSIIIVGPICVDAPHLKVSVDGKTSSLTAIEGKLLHFLSVNANNICTFSQIGSHIWGSNNDGDTNLIKVCIRHLRLKVEPDPNNPTYILTVPGVGYTLVSHP